MPPVALVLKTVSVFSMTLKCKYLTILTVIFRQFLLIYKIVMEDIQPNTQSYVCIICFSLAILILLSLSFLSYSHKNNCIFCLPPLYWHSNHFLHLWVLYKPCLFSGNLCIWVWRASLHCWCWRYTSEVGLMVHPQIIAYCSLWLHIVCAFLQMERKTST